MGVWGLRPQPAEPLIFLLRPNYGAPELRDSWFTRSVFVEQPGFA